MLDLDIIIKESKSWTEVCNKTLGKKGGSRIKKLRAIAEKESIDYSHFVFRGTHLRIIKVCPVCSKDFKTVIGTKHEKITCSYSCSNTYFRTKKNNESKYSYRQNALNTYGIVCNICGEKRSHVLQVHHIDENRKNNSISNLIVLCANCHLEIHYQNKLSLSVIGST